MTLIITAVGKNFVIQASDRRLTTSSGALYDDNANKALCVVCRDAVFAMAYTGLAHIGRKRTDEWLVDELSEMDVGNLSFIELWMALKGKLEPVFNKLQVDRRHRGLVIAFAGYRPVPETEGPLKKFAGQVEGFAGQLSNIDDDAAKPLPEPDDQFCWHSWWHPNIKKLKRLLCVIHGAEQAVGKKDILGLDSIAKNASSKAPEITAARCVYLIRRISNNEKHGALIGKDCMSVIVSRTGKFTTKYHPQRKSPIGYAPHFITGSMSFKDIYFRQGGRSRGRKP